LYNNNTTISL